MSERLYRSRTDRVLAGVCGGLAERLHVDPALIRIAWVVLALTTGVVPFLVLYVVMAIVVPERPVDAAVEAGGGAGLASPRRSGDLATILGAALVVLGLVFLLDRWFWIRIDWNLVWPAALVIIGLVLILQGARTQPS